MRNRCKRRSGDFHCLLAFHVPFLKSAILRNIRATSTAAGCHGITEPLHLIQPVIGHLLFLISSAVSLSSAIAISSSMTGTYYNFKNLKREFITQVLLHKNMAQCPMH
jgi:hypothetical protein